MPRLHSDMLLPLIRAAFSKARSSSDVTRTRRNLPLDAPLGSFGLPGFLLVFFASVTLLGLLYDCGSYGCLWGYHRRNMQHGYVSLWLHWIVCIVCPGINPIGLRMASQPEDFDNPIPNHLALMPLRDRHTFDMRGSGVM